MISAVIELKEKGNEAFRVKEFEKATELFSNSITLLNEKVITSIFPVVFVFLHSVDEVFVHEDTISIN